MPKTRVRIPSSASRFKDSHTGVVQMAGQRILTPPMQVRSLPPVLAAHSTVAQWKSTRLLTAGLRVRPPPVELQLARSVRRRRRSAKPSAAGSTPARASTSSGRSSAWKRARAWGARGRWFESSRPDLLAATRQSSGCSSAWPERTVRIREVAGSNPATQTCSSSTTGCSSQVEHSPDKREVPVQFRAPRLPCSGMRLDRSTAVYRVNRVRFPVGALLTGRSFGSSPNSKSGTTGFDSLAACHSDALVAQLEEHRFRKPAVVGSNPTQGLLKGYVAQPVEHSVCTREARVRIPATPLMSL